MAKITLSTIGSRYGSIDALNANFDAIEEAFQNTVSRDGTGPNFLTADLDANSSRIINLPVPTFGHEAANKGYVDGVTAVLQDYLEEIGIVSENIDAVIAVAEAAPFIAENADNINAVATNIDDVIVVSNNIGSVNLVGLDLNGAFQTGVIYDFGAITDEPVGPAPEADSNIVIVANNITDVNTVAQNIQAVLDSYINAQNAEASAAEALASEQAAALSEAAALASEQAAETAEENAVLAQAGAELAESGAIDAQLAAEAAEVAAEAARDLADGYADDAANSASLAADAQVAAEAARDQTLAAFDDFDDRYLGPKAADPTLDNDGDPLEAGALYFNTVEEFMKVYTGTVWVDAYAAGQSFLAKANNLSDLPNTSTARTNLGLGTMAVETATDYLAVADAGALAFLDEVDTDEITDGAVTSSKLAATLDFGSIV
jgi:hypothetical protein